MSVMKTEVTDMKVTRADNGLIAEQANENIAVLDELFPDGYCSKVMKNDDSAIGQFGSMLEWYNQLQADGKALPDDIKSPGYNPETQSVLKADDPSNCQEYRELYVRMLIPRAAKKLIEHFDNRTPAKVENMNPKTAAAIEKLAVEAQKVVDQAAMA